MARVVRFTETGPIKIDPATLPVDAEGKPKPIFICACGISGKFPFCDGSHKACREETPGSLYTYDPITKAVTKAVIETRVEGTGDAGGPHNPEP